MDGEGDNQQPHEEQPAADQQPEEGQIPHDAQQEMEGHDMGGMEGDMDPN
jgi:hypothetical protein